MNFPADNLSLGESHRFGNGCRKVDVVLVRCLLPANELDFCWVSHLMPPAVLFIYLALMLEPRMQYSVTLDKHFLNESIIV